MSIRYIEDQKLFLLETRHSSYQMKIDPAGHLSHLYYGRGVLGTDMGLLASSCDRGFSGNPYDLPQAKGASLDLIPQEYSTYGVGDYRASALMIRAADGSFGTDLRFSSFEIREGKYSLPGLPYVRPEGDAVQTLDIQLTDAATGLTVHLLYGVFEEKDVVTRSARMENGGEQTLHLLKAATLCLDFPYGEYECIHFSGKHCMERKPERRPVTQGILETGSRRGISSHQANPFIILCSPRTDESTGDAYGAMLAYSGNHREEVEMDQAGLVRLVMGIHDDGFDWKLEPGESFSTPEGILAYSSEGLNGLSQLFHEVIRRNVCDQRFADHRPILLNSWEASYFTFHEESIYQLALEAKKLGAEMLVLDDGWFGTRDDDFQGLGDWFPNEEKLKGGLGALAKKIQDLGLSFGLWWEPEMINENSALYRARPDWAMKEPGRDPMIARNQLVLDLSRPEVRDYLFDCIRKLITETSLTYIKWDCNRGLANVYSFSLPADRQGEVAHRFVLGTYELLARIREAFPQVLIEGCAGGGGRFDAGMLFYCPQIWCSDNTDPIARLKIQRGTSYGYPPCTMGSHVSASPNHQTGRTTPLSTRGLVASAGVLGYELDPASLSEEEKEEVREQIARYKEKEALVLKGRYFRLGEGRFAEHYSAWSFVSEDQSRALVTLVATDLEANAPFPYLRLKGLKEEALYQMEGSTLVCSGAALMYGGLSLDQMRGDYPARELTFVQVE